jgi:WD40 repeat protein
MKDPYKTYPKGVCFADDARIIVTGSDHGLVYVFDRKSGRCLDTLKHANEGGVQTITMSEVLFK